MYYSAITSPILFILREDSVASELQLFISCRMLDQKNEILSFFTIWWLSQLRSIFFRLKWWFLKLKKTTLSFFDDPPKGCISREHIGHKLQSSSYSIYSGNTSVPLIMFLMAVCYLLHVPPSGERKKKTR